MFNVGAPELIVILVIALIFLGPKQLPEAARSLGKFMREIKRATNEMNHAIQREAEEFHEMHKETKEEVRKAVEIKIVPDDLSVANQEKPKNDSRPRDS